MLAICKYTLTYKRCQNSFCFISLKRQHGGCQLDKNHLPTIFNYKQHEVRSLLDEKGDIWFVAADVCSVLEHSDVSKAVSRLDDDEKLLRTMFASGQNRELLCVNEPGLYGLILTSRKKEAKKFKRWLKHEVLPSIRKTGSYQQPRHARFNNIWEERKVLFHSETKLPAGYWCVFEMVAGFCEGDEYRNVMLIEQATPDISVGLKWCQRLRERGFDMSLIQKYEHVYPDKRGRQPANIYPNAWLGEYWTWFHGTYLAENYPLYLKGRLASDGMLQIHSSDRTNA
jgi:prophage antirepressor-like protein